MPEKVSRHLLDRLAEIQDPRNNKGKRHPLKSILGLNIIGFMTGHKAWTSIATWARTQPDLTRTLGWTHKKTPCPATIHNVLRDLDVDAVEIVSNDHRIVGMLMFISFATIVDEWVEFGSLSSSLRNSDKRVQSIAKPVAVVNHIFEETAPVFLNKSSLGTGG